MPLMLESFLIGGWRMIRPQSKESTNENNTDVDRWTDARRLRINGKRCSKPSRYLNLPARLAGSRQRYCSRHDMRLPLTIKRWRCPNLLRLLRRIALECELRALRSH